MPNATNLNPLIADNSVDTLLNCADAIAYLERENTVEHADGESKNETAGRFVVLRCIEGALRHEATRVSPQSHED